MSSRLRETPHPDTLWGVMFYTSAFTESGGYEWKQRGPLFPTMNEAAAWGEANKGEYELRTPQLQPYRVTPTEVTTTFSDPNNEGDETAE